MRGMGVLVPVFLAGLAAFPSASQAQDWQLLGTRRVSFAAEKDVVAVTACEGLFRAVRIDVEAGDLEMFDVRVVFGNGEAFSPQTRINFREGSRSRVVELPGDARAINRIEFSYRSRIRAGRATVRVYGQQAGGGRREGDRVDASARQFAGWNRLGSRAVDFRADRDAISAVGEGRFRQIMIAVDGGDLEMFNVQVVFGDGQSFSPATRLYFRDNSRSRIIDLPGGARVIRRLEFAYRSVVGGREGKARVDLLAK